MPNPIIFDGTGHREMTDAEHVALQQVRADMAAEQAERDAAEADKAAAAASGRAKLADLGLTDDEIKALLGV